jgi:hypothetical protein
MMVLEELDFYENQKSKMKSSDSHTIVIETFIVQ